MKKGLIVLGIVVLVFAVVNFPKNKNLPPDQMVGAWKTDDARYADRFFRLTKTSVIFGVGDNEIDVYFISDTKILNQGSDEVVQLSLKRSGGAETQLSLIHNDQEGESLTFLNQPGVSWFRVGEDELLFN